VCANTQLTATDPRNLAAETQNGVNRFTFEKAPLEILQARKSVTENKQRVTGPVHAEN